MLKIGDCTGCMACANLEGSVIAIGKFGVFHKGHEALLNILKNEAGVRNLLPVIFSFSPPPNYFFRKDVNSLPLFSIREKYEILKTFFNDRQFLLLIQKFNNTFANLSGEDFAKFLKQKLNAKIIVVGDDFRFGKGRESNVCDLKKLGEKYGFTVISVPQLKDEGEIISTSSLRKNLQMGNMEALNASLAFGVKYSIYGRVIKGANLAGTVLGFKTANIRPFSGIVMPKFGVYAIYASIDGKLHEGIANIGIKPTINGVLPLFEAHFFDFDKNLYGKKLRIFITKFVRGEKKFPALTELKLQIEQDILGCKELKDIRKFKEFLL